MRTANSLITLAGDAAHPMTPNLGQGGCVATEVHLVMSVLHCQGQHQWLIYGMLSLSGGFTQLKWT